MLVSFFWFHGSTVGIKIATIHFLATCYNSIYGCKLCSKIKLYIHFRTNKISATAYITKPETRFKG